MAIRSDSARLEKQYLLDMLAVAGARILEIGCGDGRLTRQYAELAGTVVGIDPARDSLRDAIGRKSLSATYLQASSLDLPFTRRCFDHAIFAWSF